MDLRDRLKIALGQRPATAAVPLERVDEEWPTDVPVRLAVGPARDGSTTAPRPAAEVLLPPTPPGERDLDVAAHLPGFWQDTPAGRVFVVERRFELEHEHGSIPLGRLLDVAPALLARLGREAALAAVDLRKVAFIDTETTGLAGGTGTVAFLIGMGHFLDGHFRLRQYFLEDLDQEEAMIRALTDYLADFDGVVTFNGKTFDMPLLETRVRMTRVRRGLGELAHLDLLHPARRLYRDRIPSCRLQELERQFLGLERVADIPGWEIPSVYFRYVRSRRFRALMPVFEHNALDVLSMVTLASHLAGVWRGERFRNGGDRLALGRAHEHDGDHDEALSHYRAALDCNDLRPVERDECDRRLAALYKKLGRQQDALAVWLRVANRPENHALYPLVEIARYHERVTKDHAAARAACYRALALLESYHARMGYARLHKDRAALTARVARLDARIERASGKLRSGGGGPDGA